jgi:hypothetical protein
VYRKGESRKEEKEIGLVQGRVSRLPKLCGYRSILGNNKERSNMSVHKIREQFNQMLLKIGLIPEPKKYIPIIKPNDE